MDSFVVGNLAEVENVVEFIEGDTRSVLLDEGYTLVSNTPPPTEDYVLDAAQPSGGELFPRPGSVDENAEELEFRAKFKKAKKDFLRTVEMQEYLENELRVHQRALKEQEEDKFFLLERLLLYQKQPVLLDSPESGEGSDSDTEDGKKLSISSSVTFSSAFSKVKSFSAGRRNKKSKIRGSEEVLESPSDSFGTYEEESTGLAPNFSFQGQEDSE